MALVGLPGGFSGYLRGGALLVANDPNALERGPSLIRRVMVSSMGVVIQDIP